MTTEMSVTALLSAALVPIHPVRASAAGACFPNAAASLYGWWDMTV